MALIKDADIAALLSTYGVAGVSLAVLQPDGAGDASIATQVAGVAEKRSEPIPVYDSTYFQICSLSKPTTVPSRPLSSLLVVRPLMRTCLPISDASPRAALTREALSAAAACDGSGGTGSGGAGAGGGVSTGRSQLDWPLDTFT